MRWTMRRWAHGAVLLLGVGCHGSRGDAKDPDGASTPDCPTAYEDADGDGFGAAEIAACSLGPNQVRVGGDCDDGDPAVHPGAQEICDPADVDEDCDGLADDADPDAAGALSGWPDADGDGYGADDADGAWCDPPAPLVDRGGDCDNADPEASPEGVERWADGVDQDCDGHDEAGFRDDFELGVTSLLWVSSNGSAEPTQRFTYDGAWAVELNDDAALVSRAVDTTACGALIWRYCTFRGPSEPWQTESLFLEYTTPGVWHVLHQVRGDNTSDEQFQCHEGVLDDPAALWSGLQVRLRVDSGNPFFVDALYFGCPGEDADGDGHGVFEDCDDSDDRHWSDCGTCDDPDGDDTGPDCDQGPDCDPADAAIGRLAPDAPDDGVDADCDGVDGTWRRFDFESGYTYREDLEQWTGGAEVEELAPIAGRYSLFLQDGEVVTRPVVATACDAIQWSLRLREDPALLPGDTLELAWFDGAAWVPAQTWVADGQMERFDTRYDGEITDPGALHDRLRLRLSTTTGGSFTIDDWTFGCPADADGDTRAAPADCDETDPDHWNDCGACTDTDLDGFGAGCDLGPDCDDTDPAAHPGGTEIAGDGVDQDCDGLDAAGWGDAFDAGGLDPAIWDTPAGSVVIADLDAASGRHAAMLRGDGAVLPMLPIDTSGCTELAWRVAVKRGPPAPDPATTLALEGWDGAGWQAIQTFLGTGEVDLRPNPTGGTLAAQWALQPALELRLRVAGSVDGAFLVDDLVVACGTGDSDGDGFAAPLDCDDGDPGIDRFCWTCVDLDGDGVPQRCAFGAQDCAPDDPQIHPGASDPPRDGVDQDCNGWDGPGFRDSFESGVPDPLLWTPVVGAWGTDPIGQQWGDWSLELRQSDVRLESIAMDITGCPGIYLHASRAGGDAINGAARLQMQWYDGTAWTDLSVSYGADTSMVLWPLDGTWVQYANPEFRFGILATDLGPATYHVDEVLVRCGEVDLDYDGHDTAVDCDDGDDLHWSDCATCTDLDGDGYGTGCDLGDDCNDAAMNISPAVLDWAANGADSDCDGMDLALAAADFEAGAGPYTLPDAGAVIDGTWVGRDAHALRLTGAGSVTGPPVDTTGCTDAVAWHAVVKRGPEPPDAGDALIAEYLGPAGWVEVGRLEGDGTVDGRFEPFVGTIADADARATDFQFRLRVEGGGDAIDAFFVDDVRCGCPIQ